MKGIYWPAFIVFLIPILVATQTSAMNLIRNGDFELGDTAWGKSQWTYRDNGMSGVGMRVSPLSEPNNQGFIMQELHLPSNIKSGNFSFAYNFQAQQGLNPFLQAFWASLVTPEGEIIGLLSSVDANSFPGYGWQSFRVALNAQVLQQLNAAHKARKRVFLLMGIIGQYIEVLVDNLALEVDGTIEVPNLSGTIAYIHSGKEIRSIRPNGADQKLVWASPNPNSEVTTTIYDVAWHPNSSKIAFSSEHEFGFSRWSTDIYTIRPDGSNIKRLTNPPARSNIRPGDYPTGKVVGKVHNRTGRYISVAVYVQGALKPAQMSGAIIAPDRFSSDTQSFTVDVPDLGPGVGQYVAVWEEGYSECETVVDVQAGKTVDIGTIEYGGYRNRFGVAQICWRKDGAEMAFVLSGTSLRKISASASFADVDLPIIDLNLFISGAAWSPQGDKFLYVQMLPLEKQGIYLTDIAGRGEGVRIAAFPEAGSSCDYPVWLPDGSGFLFVGRRSKQGVIGGDIYHYGLNSGQLSPLTDFWNESASNMTLSPDGKYIVFERHTENSERQDLWLMKSDDPTSMWQLTDNGQSANPDWGSP